MATTKYYVKNELTQKFLATDGSWVGSIGDEKTASWDVEASAVAAKPSGVECYILKVVKDDKPVKPAVKGAGPSSKNDA